MIERRGADRIEYPALQSLLMDWNGPAEGPYNTDLLLPTFSDVESLSDLYDVETLDFAPAPLSPVPSPAAESPRHQSQVFFPALATPQPHSRVSQGIPAAESPQPRSKRSKEYNTMKQRECRQRKRENVEDLRRSLKETEAKLKDARDRLEVAGAAALLCPQLLKVIMPTTSRILPLAELPCGVSLR